MAVKSALSRVIQDAVIRRLAGAESYRRGLDYFTHGHVESLEERDGALHAVVRGKEHYSVRLVADDGVLDYACDCLAGARGSFCKHCVATGLAWLKNTAAPGKSKVRSQRKEVTLADSARFLAAEQKDTLVRMIVDWAKEDNQLRERLILYAARRAGPEAGVAAAQRAFEKAVHVRDFVHYREAAGWARAVDHAIDSIVQLLDDGQAAAVIGLCESALRSLSKAIQLVDDSDGHFGALRDRLQDIHFHACQQARPQPEELAKRLFQWELHSDWDIFYGAVSRYAAILGTDGMKVYEELAKGEWEKVPVRTAKSNRSESRDYLRIRGIMESLAEASGDVERLVAVMSRDLSHSYNYLKIAEVYRKARQSDQALQWAEKGLHAFPNHTDRALREFSADEYQSRNRHDEAMALMWAEFSENPSLDTYKILATHARKAGAWEKWRDQALSEIRARIARARKKSREPNRPGWMPAAHDHSLLVEIFLKEAKIDEAWKEAQEGGCARRLWLRLADHREKTHPEDAVPIYLKLADDLIQTTQNGRYEEAVGMLGKAAHTMRRMNREAEFLSSLEGLRVKYKIKRNFIKLLDQEQQSLSVGGNRKSPARTRAT